MGGRPRQLTAALHVAFCAVLSSALPRSVSAGGPQIQSERTLIENRPPDDIWGLPGLYLLLRVDVTHPDGIAGFQGPGAGATAECNNNNYPFINPTPLPDVAFTPVGSFFLTLVPIATTDFPNIQARYQYRVTDVNAATDTLLGHNLNKPEVIPLPTNLAVSNQTTTPLFTFTDPVPSPGHPGLIRRYKVLVVDGNLAGVGEFPTGDATSPSIAIPFGVLCPCVSYYLRAESYDIDVADDNLENLATAFLPFTPTSVPVTGDMTKDCLVNGRDIDSFVRACLAQSTLAGDLCTGDFSANGLMDTADMPGFVNALLGL
ncbi:MAG: hypothetical protein AABZ08_06305 [Planctomycetota bacterium]